MKNFDNVKPGDRLKRNSYSCYHFTAGKEYEVLTFQDGYPRMLTDNGVLITAAPPYSPKYFDHIVKPNPAQLRAGDLIKFTRNYFGLTKDKVYIVSNDTEKDFGPYVYNDENQVRYLNGYGFFYKVTGKLSDLDNAPKPKVSMMPQSHRQIQTDLMDKVLKAQENIIKQLITLGISEETALKAAGEIISKGLGEYAKND